MLGWVIYKVKMIKLCIGLIQLFLTNYWLIRGAEVLPCTNVNVKAALSPQLF